MSPQKRRPQARKGRTAVAAAKGGRRSDRTLFIAAGVVIVVGVALVFAFASNQTSSSSDTATKAPAELVKKITSVPGSVSTDVGSGSTTKLPVALPGPTLKKDGKPLVVYIGAEYCPYCAAERWGMAIALARFGTFDGLKITESGAAPEAFPNTPTLSFYKTSYSSPYIVFEPVETQTNTKKPLDNPSAEQQALMTKFDAPPYVDQQSSGSIPFIDIANRWLVSGASYSPSVLAGKSHGAVANDLSDATTDVAKGAVGAANNLTAAICDVTKNKPADVCNDAAIKTIQAKMK